MTRSLDPASKTTQIRSVTEAELTSLQELHRKLSENEKRFVPSARAGFSSSDEAISYYRARMDSSDGYIRICFLEGRPVGFLIGTLDGTDRSWARLESIFVDEGARGIGLGRALFEDFVRWTESVSASRITVAVAAANTDTWSIYLKLGFVEIERKGLSVILELQKDAS